MLLAIFHQPLQNEITVGFSPQLQPLGLSEDPAVEFLVIAISGRDDLNRYLIGIIKCVINHLFYVSLPIVAYYYYNIYH